MSAEELETEISKLVDDIKKQDFQGTDEEIKIQQIMYFDKYVKDNIDYGFDAINFSLKYPNAKNPYESAYRDEGFFMENETNGKRIAVCGSISSIADQVFDKLGIDSDYIWGHINVGSNDKPSYIGHRWNSVSIGNNSYMVDFTIGMIIHNILKDEAYMQGASQLVDSADLGNEFRYLFFDKLSSRESIGGFKKDERGRTIDDISENGSLNSAITDAHDILENLESIPTEYLATISKYVDNKHEKSL